MATPPAGTAVKIRPDVDHSPPSYRSAGRKSAAARARVAGMWRDERWVMRSCAFLIVATAACTHHHPVASLAPAAPSSYAFLELDDGSIRVVHAAATAQGVRWVAPDDDETRGGDTIVEATALRRYTTFNHARGLGEGLAIGLFTGAALGAVAGLAQGDQAGLPGSAGIEAGLGALAGGGAGLAIGALIGACLGTTEVYELDAARRPRVSASITPGQAGGAASWSF
jgi:hypothetical protein